jgi:hypothetical protein
METIQVTIAQLEAILKSVKQLKEGSTVVLSSTIVLTVIIQTPNRLGGDFITAHLKDTEDESIMIY